MTDHNPVKARLLGLPWRGVLVALSCRCRKCLTRLDIHTLGELIQHAPKDLLRMRNFGRASLNEIRRKLFALGLRLRDDDGSDLVDVSAPAPEQTVEAADLMDLLMAAQAVLFDIRRSLVGGRKLTDDESHHVSLLSTAVETVQRRVQREQDPSP